MKALCYAKPFRKSLDCNSSSFNATLILVKPNHHDPIRHTFPQSIPRPYLRTVAHSTSNQHTAECQAVDDTLSKRPISLDDCYFIIYIDRSSYQIVAEYYTNLVNANGLAVDPETKQVIPCGSKRPPTQVYRAKTAKELSVLIIETEGKVTRADHANYLGREFQKAEFSMLYPSQYDYVQD